MLKVWKAPFKFDIIVVFKTWIEITRNQAIGNYNIFEGLICKFCIQLCCTLIAVFLVLHPNCSVSEPESRAEEPVLNCLPKPEPKSQIAAPAPSILHRSEEIL